MLFQNFPRVINLPLSKIKELHGFFIAEFLKLCLAGISPSYDDMIEVGIYV